MHANNIHTSFKCLLNRVKERKMSISREQAAQMVMLIKQGVSIREVGWQFSCDHQMVSHIYHRCVETSSFMHQPRSGCSRVTTTKEDCCLVRLVQQDLLHTSAHLCGLRQHGMRSRRPSRGPVLSHDHRRRHLDFAHNHESWTDIDWASVFFTTECRFCPQGADGHGRVWWCHGERYRQENFIRRSNYWGSSIMVWGAISSDAHTDLHICQKGTATAHSYSEDILLLHVVSFAGFVCPEFLLMQDNVHLHVAQKTTAFLHEVGINKLEWPCVARMQIPLSTYGICSATVSGPVSHPFSQGPGNRSEGEMGSDSTRGDPEPYLEYASASSGQSQGSGKECTILRTTLHRRLLLFHVV